MTKPEPVEMSIYEFASIHGLKTDLDVQAHIHGGMRCQPRWKTWHRWFDQEFDRLQKEADGCLVLYQDAIDRGEIKPRRKLTTEEIAARDDGSEACEAAKRVLVKRAKRLAEMQKDKE